MIKHDTDGYWIDMQEVIAAPHADVMSCFATAEGLCRWLPVSAQIEPRAGGEIVLGWDSAFTHTTTIIIVEFDLNGTIVWDWYAAANEPHARMYWKIDTDLHDGTIVHLRQGPFAEDPETLIAMAEEAASWRWQLCNLRSVLEVHHDMRRSRPL